MRDADTFPDHSLYKRERERFMNGKQSGCYTVGFSGFMGFQSVAVAISESRYREITKPITVLIITGWLGCWAVCSTAVIVLFEWRLGLTVAIFGALAIVATATVEWRTPQPDNDRRSSLFFWAIIGAIALVVIIKGSFGFLVTILTLLATVTTWMTITRGAITRLRRSALDDAGFYEFGLRAGLMSLRNYSDLAG